MIQKGGLKNTVITIVTQHPPLAEFHDEARQIAVAFGIRINVLWISDIVFNACSDEQISDFKTFVDITGGLFVQLQAENGDQNNINVSEGSFTSTLTYQIVVRCCRLGFIIKVLYSLSGEYLFRPIFEQQLANNFSTCPKFSILTVGIS